MKRITLIALTVLLAGGLFLVIHENVYAKSEKGQGGPNGTFVRFDDLDSYWKETKSGLLHEWRTTDNKHFIFKPADRFESADCGDNYLNSFSWTAHIGYDQSYPFDEANLEDFLEVGDKYWVCVYAWDSNKSISRPEWVQTLIINADDEDGEASMILASDKEYRFLVSGTAYAGANIFFDADYSSRNGGPWQDKVLGYETYGDKLLQLMLDGNETYWGEVDDIGHNYEMDYMGTGSTVNFTIYDIFYSNNTGSLTVEIYEM